MTGRNPAELGHGGGSPLSRFPSSSSFALLGFLACLASLAWPARLAVLACPALLISLLMGNSRNEGEVSEMGEASKGGAVGGGLLPFSRWPSSFLGACGPVASSLGCGSVASSSLGTCCSVASSSSRRLRLRCFFFNSALAAMDLVKGLSKKECPMKLTANQAHRPFPQLAAQKLLQYEVIDSSKEGDKEKDLSVVWCWCAVRGRCAHTGQQDPRSYWYQVLGEQQGGDERYLKSPSSEAAL